MIVRSASIYKYMYYNSIKMTNGSSKSIFRNGKMHANNNNNNVVCMFYMILIKNI